MKTFSTKNLKQSVTFNALPKEVYEMLMDSKKHAKFTGAKAKISQKEGGKFTAWDGYIDGTNIKLVTGKKILQLWRSDEKDWPADHYSRATFSFKNGKKKGTTLLSFSQTGIPSKVFADIKQGWKDYYWTPMKEMISKK